MVGAELMNEAELAIVQRSRWEKNQLQDNKRDSTAYEWVKIASQV